MTATCTNGIYLAPYTSFYDQGKTKKNDRLFFFHPKYELPRDYTAFRDGRRQIRFKKAQKIAWHKAEDDYVALRFEPLHIHAVGANRDEAIKDFWDELEFVWRNYARCAESELTQDAIELKHRVQEYLTEG